MNRRFIASILTAATVAALSAVPAFAQSRHAGTINLNGVGSSADAPLFNVMFNGAHFNYNGNSVVGTYDSIGSGGGQKSYAYKCGQAGGTPGSWDWGAWDVPQGIPGDNFCDQSEIFQFPVTAFGIAMISNLPSKITAVLRFTGPIIEGIYTGGITKWGDTAIKKANPALLPVKKKVHGHKKTVCDNACKAYKGVMGEIITPVVRLDASGTSFGFTSYLCSVGSAYAAKYGFSPTFCPSKKPTWTWTAGNTNAGVDAAVQNTKGAIGYVETTYSSQNGETPAYVKNKAGKYIRPTVGSIAADVNNGSSPGFNETWPKFAIANAGGKASYPISTLSRAGIYKSSSNSDDPDPSNCAATKALFGWLLSSDKQVTNLEADNSYVALTGNVDSFAKTRLAEVSC